MQVRAGVVTPTAFPAAVNGATSRNFAYSEVGYFKLAAGGIVDSSFTAADQSANRCIAGSSANTLVGGKYGCNIASTVDSLYFGRFIPYTFKTSLHITNQGCSDGPSPFTYFGGEFSTKFNIEAANDSTSSSAAVYRTQNYSGNFARFATGAIGTTYGNYHFTLSPALSGVTLSQGSAAPLFNTAWSSGTAVVTATHKATRPSTLTAPSSVMVQAQPSDTEATAVAPTTLSSTLLMRLGRLKFENGYGAETMPLNVNIYAQYWNGTTWQVNTDDYCSPLAAGSIYMNFPSATRNHLLPCDTVLTASNAGSKFRAGVAKYVFSAPGHGHHGWLTMSANLGMAGGGSKSACTVLNTPTPSTVAGLTQFVDSALGEQAATVSFGQYTNKVIYNREN